MASAGNSTEMGAIEAAYAVQLQTLYKQLATALGDAAVTHQTEQQSLAKFTTGLKIAKRARELALNEVGVRAPVALTRRAKSKK
jgi:hypothetical protein